MPNVTTGKGFTMIVNAEGVPVQLFAVGSTEIVEVIATVPALVTIKDGISPVPLDAIPIAVLEFVHAKVVPVVRLVKVIAGIVSPLHEVILAMLATEGIGFTVILYVDAVPGQPLAEGVTVIVAVIGSVPVLVAVKAAIFPVPLA